MGSPIEAQGGQDDGFRNRHARFGAKRRKDPEYRAKQAEWNRAWRAENAKSPEVLARRAEYRRAYSQLPEVKKRDQACRKVRREIEAGRMVRQSCEVCGHEKSEAHHDDYDRPLDIRWLCRPHHRAHHAQLKATGGAA